MLAQEKANVMTEAAQRPYKKHESLTVQNFYEMIVWSGTNEKLASKTFEERQFRSQFQTLRFILFNVFIYCNH